MLAKINQMASALPNHCQSQPQIPLQAKSEKKTNDVMMSMSFVLFLLCWTKTDVFISQSKSSDVHVFFTVHDFASSTKILTFYGRPRRWNPKFAMGL